MNRVRITEALKILQSAAPSATPFRVVLACGFTPLHLSTFLGAHLQKRLAERRVQIVPGLYGDLAGTVQSLAPSDPDAVAIALEWSDLDPRLGFRSAAAWGPEALLDILAEVQRSCARLLNALVALPAGVPIALQMPTLPLPPLFHTAGFEASEAELRLRRNAADFALELRARSHVRMVNQWELASLSPVSARFDLKSELLTGLPYSLPHADAAASLLAQLLLSAQPKKGIITDLDDTLWSGLVGEVGADGVSWDLARHTAFHGLYQKMLAALADEGVLVAVASKNDEAVVAQAFARPDLLLPSGSVFPMEVHWNAKSGSVARILQKWNVAADSVVFVDDSPLELAEVANAHPGIECLQFPVKDYGTSGLALLQRLRNLFGKARLSGEDAIRAASIRNASEFEKQGSTGVSAEDFLSQLNAAVTLEWPDDASDGRILELVNKTNQFNLNGTRYTEAEWTKRVAAPQAFLLTVSYEDKFGPLGKISVLQGTSAGDEVVVDVWVLSCRAFARRIEFQTLQALFECFRHARSIRFRYSGTAKNGPLTSFLTNVCEVPPDDGCTVTRDVFLRQCPPLYATVRDQRRVEVNG